MLFPFYLYWAMCRLRTVEQAVCRKRRLNQGCLGSLCVIELGVFSCALFFICTDHANVCPLGG